MCLITAAMGAKREENRAIKRAISGTVNNNYTAVVINLHLHLAPKIIMHIKTMHRIMQASIKCLTEILRLSKLQILSKIVFALALVKN